MFNLMNKVQGPVLIVAGLMTALLFGLSDIVQYLRKDQQVSHTEMSPELRRDIIEKLQLMNMLKGQSPGADREALIKDYANNLMTAEREGVGVGDPEVQQAIMAQFKSKESYQNFLKNAAARRITARLYEGYHRDMLTFQKSMMLKMLPGYITSREIKEEFHNQFDEFHFEVFKVNSEKVKIDENFTDEEMQAFYDENIGNAEFEESEKVQIEYLWVNPEEIAVSTPTNVELRQHYQIHRDKYTSAEFPGESEPYFAVVEQIESDMIKQKRDDEAKKLLNQLDTELLQLDDEKRNLSQTLKEETKKNEKLKLVKYGISDFFTQGDYIVEPLGYVSRLTSQVFGERVREYDGVLDAANGFYIYQIKDRKAKRTKTFEECKDTIIEELKFQRRDERSKTLADEWKVKLEASTDWGSFDISSSLELTYSKTKSDTYFDRDLKDIKALELNVVSEVLKTKEGYSIARLLERKKADEAKLEDEREQLKNNLLRQKMQIIRMAMMPTQ